MGMVNLGNLKVSIDGSKIRANASSKQSKDELSLEKELSACNKEISRILLEAEAKDQEEDKLYASRHNNELPSELQDYKTLQIKLKSGFISIARDKRGDEGTRVKKRDDRE